MKITTILNVHGDTELVNDTIDSIKHYVGNNILVVVDGTKWESWGKNTELNAYKIEGLKHGIPSSPYRNAMLGISTASKMWTDSDWYCYCEYDVLFGSEEFKYSLQNAESENTWCVGNDLRYKKNTNFPILEKILKYPITEIFYLLGCCTFHSGDFIRLLNKINFFDRFLFYTSIFSPGVFPNYKFYDVNECILPTLARAFKGNVSQFACWHEKEKKWNGNKNYPMRWQPELDGNHESASIMHPVKNINNKLRILNREKRRNDRSKNNLL